MSHWSRNMYVLGEIPENLYTVYIVLHNSLRVMVFFGYFVGLSAEIVLMDVFADD